MDWETKEGRCTLVCWAGAVVIGIVAYLLLDTFLLKLLAQILAIVIGIGAGVVLSQTFCVARESDVSPEDISPDAVAPPKGEPQPGATPQSSAPATRGSAALAQPGSGGTTSALKPSGDAQPGAEGASEAEARPRVAVPPDDATSEWDEAQESGSTSATSAVAYEGGDGDKPKLLDAPRGGVADKLQDLPGVGPKVEEALNGLGVFHFAQIGAWTPKNLAWVEAQLPTLKGRAERNDWIKNANVLARGGVVDKGDVVDE